MIHSSLGRWGIELPCGLKEFELQVKKKLLKHRQILGINLNLWRWSLYLVSRYFYGLGSCALFGLFLVHFGRFFGQFFTLKHLQFFWVEVLVEEFFSSASLGWIWPWGTHKFTSLRVLSTQEGEGLQCQWALLEPAHVEKAAVTPTNLETLV